MADDRIEQIRAAVWENHRAPNGTARNARAEELVAQAEDTGDTALLLETLSQLITAYEYSAERGKMFVPFARMLQMWDQDPGRFDDQMAYELFWRFKWVTGSMIDYPDIPLASIEQWLGEMERRYRLAGYRSRTVRAEEFFVAWHLGDIPRAEAAYTDWLAGDRDRMSNCHACEAGSQGRWEAFQGRDELALQRWAEVLAGRLTCAEEPHRVLSYALLPLLRLGGGDPARIDQARTNHLRGYRMARGNESLLATVGRHIEFCALTGNEARGLEILAEHARYLVAGGNPDSVLSLLEAAVLLLDRLIGLGLGERGTSGPASVAPGGSWTVASLRDHCDSLRTELTGRFDRRNGTDAVSADSERRIRQQPVLERLPLGVSAVLGSGAAPVVRPAAPPAAASFEELVVEARRLREIGHPTTRQAWLAVEAALGDVEPDDLLRAELATQRGIRGAAGDAEAAVLCFEEAAAAYRGLGQDGDAAVGEGRAALATAFAGRAEQARGRAETAVAAARAALAAGRGSARDLAVAQLCRTRVLSLLVGGSSEPGAGQDPARAEVEAALVETVEAIGAIGRAEGAGAAEIRSMHGLLGDVHRNRAGLAEPQFELMLPALRASADAYLLAEEPWDAAEMLLPLAQVHAQLGDLAAAEAAAQEALRHGEGFLGAEEAGRVQLLLADLLSHRGAHEQAVQHALEATRWLDEAGLAAAEGTAARHRLAGCYQALGRHAEAAEVLQSALPDLIARGERAEVAARRALGQSLGELGEHAEAAEQFARAAQIVDGWGEPYPSAQLASNTAEALSAAGRAEQAEAVYLRAQGLWAEAGEPGMVVRTLRSRAWLTFSRGRDADPGRALMLQAEAAARAAIADPALPVEDAEELRREQADTWRQLGGLLRDVAEDEGWNGLAITPELQAVLYEEAWEAYRTAAEGFAACADPGPALSAQARLDAARIRIETGRHGVAAAELKQVQALAEAAGEPLAAVGKRAAAILAWLEEQAAAD